MIAEEEVTQQVEQLQTQLTQRGNQLISQDPMSQRIMGQIEAFKAMIAPDPSVSGNGELIEEKKE